MCNNHDFPSQAELEKISNLLLKFDVDKFLKSLNADTTKVFELSAKFNDDVLTQIGLLLHDMKRGIDRSSLITDFIVEIVKLGNHYLKSCDEIQNSKSSNYLLPTDQLNKLNTNYCKNEMIKEDTHIL